MELIVANALSKLEIRVELKCTTDFQSVVDSRYRWTGIPSYSKKLAVTAHSFHGHTQF
jgi:hypothetical protein